MKTIQDQYLELVREIEKLPASEQQTKVILMFNDFHKSSSELMVDAVMKFDTFCDQLRDTKDAEILQLQSTITALKANSIALADHARFMSEAHDGGRCKAALKNHADLMEKLKEAGI